MGNETPATEGLEVYAKPELKEVSIATLINTTAGPMSDPSPCSVVQLLINLKRCRGPLVRAAALSVIRVPACRWHSPWRLA